MIAEDSARRSLQMAEVGRERMLQCQGDFHVPRKLLLRRTIIWEQCEEARSIMAPARLVTSSKREKSILQVDCGGRCVL